MSSGLLSVDDVAERLGLHPRTVRGYIRSGRLPATRIGKQYRITQADFTALTAPVLTTPVDRQQAAGRDSDRTASGSQVAKGVVGDSTAIVQIDRLDDATGQRLLTLLSAGVYGGGVRTDLALDRTAGRLKIVTSGTLAATIAFLSIVDETVEGLGVEV